jgi:3-oxoacyl-[acyl-carrier protein] reductase
MDLGLDGRVAMVASASKGIGLACARLLAREGCDVSICARGQEALDAALAEIARESKGARVHASVVDVARADDLERWNRETEAALGPASILVTNTGGPPVAPFGDLDDAAWYSGVDSTLMNVVRMCRSVLPAMKAARWGRIVHLTSLVAKQPMLELTISSTLRAGLSGLTKTMANEFGPFGVTVNAVLPGHVLTDRQKHLAEVRSKAQGISEADYYAAVAAAIPVRRLGEPAEIADAVGFLCSTRAAFVNGVSLQVDGGLIQSTF